LPELKVIKQGALTGFVNIHPHWSGFKAKDYIIASQSADETENSITDELEIELPDGEFDFRGYEIARSQFFNISDKTFMTVSATNVAFSLGCIRRLNNIQYVEILIYPKKRLLAIRPSDKDKNLSVKWAKRSNGEIISKTISGRAFLNAVYEIFCWNLSWKYRIQGTYYNRDNMPIIIFDISDAEVFISGISEDDGSDNNFKEHIASISNSGKNIVGYPAEWIDGFGYNFYTHAQVKELENFTKTGKWDTDVDGEPCQNDSIPNVADKDELNKNINN
ncbi:MAG: hypothetical protein LIO65_01950, partial [Odoribacter sp.]|nr:hypothetical protein [Odoribacter sp.]